ncbi:MAG: biotin transporter BioY [Gammaproteobacteria bacterium]|nr:biotin transporter BioY [Gammaproteobacteria bacterium]MDH3464450.1 biotin transporter BioY [Gammaproteobacteria bacterium]
MKSTTLGSPTLAAELWPSTDTNRWARNTALVIGGSLLLWVTAKAQIPFWPVPITMQTFAVLLLGAAYGWRLGGAAVLLYLAEGAVGLPVFAKGGGFAYLYGFTGGYLLGFLLAALAVGWLAQRGWDRSPVTTVAAMVIGEVIIFGLGVAWLANLIGLEKAVAAGVTPFLWGEAAKIALATALLPATWSILKNNGNRG